MKSDNIQDIYEEGHYLFFPEKRSWNDLNTIEVFIWSTE